ncbi:MAG: ABC transporter ATP-binding protein [Luteimonas sp.]
MSSEVVLRLRDVCKSFPAFDKPYQRLLQLFSHGNRESGQFQALRGVDLVVRRGEAVGLIGSNGSGKSTLLQIICGILQPTSGTVEATARIAALLELGAGFNPEFTGRENIRLNGSLHGLSATDINQRMDEILAFAEIGDYVDHPVKTYSSGMFVRLAFAVAVHTNPDVLIVDEALAVGDIYFQRKCYKRIAVMRQQGCTLLFVTHSVDLLLQMCDRAVLLDHGRIIFDGDAKATVAEYMKRLFGARSAIDEHEAAHVDCAPVPVDEMMQLRSGGHADQFALRSGYNRNETRVGDGRAVTCDYLVRSSQGDGPTLLAREPFAIWVRYAFSADVERLVFGLRVCTVGGLAVYSSNTFVAGDRLFNCRAGDVVIAEFRLRCALLPGQYFVTLGVSCFDMLGREIVALDRRMEAVTLTVLGGRTHAEGIADMEADIIIQDAVSGAARQPS